MNQERDRELELYRRHVEFTRIGNEAVRKAQQESRDMGVANVYSHRGRLYWELPNGELTFEDPYKDEVRSKGEGR